MRCEQPKCETAVGRWRHVDGDAKAVDGGGADDAAAAAEDDVDGTDWTSWAYDAVYASGLAIWLCSLMAWIRICPKPSTSNRRG